MDDLLEMIASSLGVDKSQVHPDSTAEGFPKWDSLRTVMLGSMLEMTYDLTLSAEEVSSLLSVPKIVSTLKSHGVEL